MSDHRPAASQDAPVDAAVALARTAEHAAQVVAPAFVSGRGASRDHLLWTAMNAWAPATTVSVLMHLPTRYYFTLDEVRAELAARLSV